MFYALLIYEGHIITNYMSESENGTICNREETKFEHIFFDIEVSLNWTLPLTEPQCLHTVKNNRILQKSYERSKCDEYNLPNPPTL